MYVRGVGDYDVTPVAVATTVPVTRTATLPDVIDAALLAGYPGVMTPERQRLLATSSSDISLWDYDWSRTGRNKWWVLMSRPGEILLETVTGDAMSGGGFGLGAGPILNVVIQLGVLYAAWKVIRK